MNWCEDGHGGGDRDKASVVPLAARVSPHSALLRSIAGEPAEPIRRWHSLLGKVGRGSYPGHRPRRGRHVHALPGPRQALTAHRAWHLSPL
jgi:hypothetical protein